MIESPFNINPQIKNLELGAGCGSFGAFYYAECFITDKSHPALLHERCKGSYTASVECDAYEIPCGKDRFNNIIMCNPYMYGFRDDEQSIIFLDELYRVLTKNGKVTILTTKNNPYSTPKRVEKRIKNYNLGAEQEKFKISVETIDPSKKYPRAIFRCGGGKTTTPNYEILLTCIK